MDSLGILEGDVGSFYDTPVKSFILWFSSTSLIVPLLHAFTIPKSFGGFGREIQWVGSTVSLYWLKGLPGVGNC